MEIFSIEKHWDKFSRNKVVVNCKTEELSKEFLTYCASKSIKWITGFELVKTNWNTYEENTCYYCFDNDLSFGQVRVALKENYKVVIFEGFDDVILTKTKEKVMNPIEFFESIVSSQLSSQINQETIKNAVFTLNNYPPTTTTKENIEVIYHRKETIVLIKTIGKYYKGVSRCHNEDTYDKELGFKIAYERARVNQNGGKY